MDMREKLIAAMLAGLERADVNDAGLVMGESERVTIDGHFDMRIVADAVLEALREPDQGMKDAARKAPLPMVLLDSMSAREDLAFEAKWKAAIDAARSD